jgi:hypothetical protein
MISVCPSVTTTTRPGPCTGEPNNYHVGDHAGMVPDERQPDMAQMTMDMLDGSDVPKRGDLLQSNVGDRRERTWFVLTVRRLKPTKGVPRCRLWIERWWDVDVELRMRLYNNAVRNGGQRLVQFTRNPAKSKKLLRHTAS